MTAACAVETWRVPRESTEWCGPIVTTLTDRSSGLPLPQNVKFALWPRDGSRPTIDDFTVPDPDPDGTAAYGIMLNPVVTKGDFGIWALDVDSPETPWLEPESVGYVTRT